MAQIREFFTEIKVGARQAHSNMTLYQPLSAGEAVADSLTVDIALATGAFSIRELYGDRSALESRVVNKSGQYPLFMDLGGLSPFSPFRRSPH
ncbi:MAG: hypothetical protein WC647_01425 [Desulfomonilaceae bacterium]|jgi:hypothetical protein